MYHQIIKLSFLIFSQTNSLEVIKCGLFSWIQGVMNTWPGYMARISCFYHSDINLLVGSRLCFKYVKCLFNFHCECVHSYSIHLICNWSSMMEYTVFKYVTMCVLCFESIGRNMFILPPQKTMHACLQKKKYYNTFRFFFFYHHVNSFPSTSISHVRTIRLTILLWNVVG